MAECKMGRIYESREIGTIGPYVIQMSLDDLRELASKEVMGENKKLKRDVKELNKAIKNLTKEWNHMRDLLRVSDKENEQLVSECQKLKKDQVSLDMKKVLSMYNDSINALVFYAEGNEDGGAKARETLGGY